MEKTGLILTILSRLHRVVKFVWNSYKESLIEKEEIITELEERFTSEDEEAHLVVGTPFTVARHLNEWYVLLGKYRMTEGFETKEEAIEDAKRDDWERRIQVMSIINNDKKQ